VLSLGNAGAPSRLRHINRSGVEFSVEITDDKRQAVRFGLGAVKENVGVGAVASIVKARDEAGPGQHDAGCVL